MSGSFEGRAEAGLALVLWLSSCGWSVHESLIVTEAGDSSSPSEDATSGSGAADEMSADSDAGSEPAPVGCIAWWGQPGWTFDAPVALESVNSSALEADPWLTRDGLRLAFSSDRPGAGGYDLYLTTREDPSAAFGVPVAQDALNSEFDDTALSWSEDGTYLLASTRGTGGLTSTLWQATREPAPLFTSLGVDAPGDNFDPSLSADGRWLRWTVDAGDNTMNLRTAYRATPEQPFEPQGLAPFESPVYDDSQSLSADGRVAVWGSERAGGLGAHDLWFATRSDPSAEFGLPAPIPAVNSAVQDREAFVTADGCSLYFASDRPGGAGGWDLYVAHARLE